MDSELLKGLAQEIGAHVDSKVNEVEERIDELAADVAAIPTIEGPQGPQGERGEKGADGIDGADGKDGVDGIDGKDGVDGADGKDGVDGKDGETVIGPEGPAGKDGVDGIDGKDGVDGADGKDGADGVDGEKGEDGLGVDTPVWSDQVYREGSVVQHHYGQYFRALTDTAADPDSDDWERVGNHGFRLTGPFSKDKTYRDGDLYVKDFGLFLWRGEDAMCIAGRGPRGERGKAGRDGVGKDGKDGRDGKDGSQIKALEFEGSTLVAVFQDADGETKEHCVSLDPFLQTAALVTKEAHAQNNKQLIEEAELQVKQLWEQLNNHLDDQDAIPIRFYRGLWKADESYQVGDWIRYGSEGLVCRRANTGVTPHNFPTSRVNAADYWQSLTGQMTHGVNSGGDDSGGGGVTASDVLVKEGGLGGTKFSQFPSVVADAQKQLSVVGLQEGKNVKAVLTTDLVSTNPDVTFRDAKGRFRSTDDYSGLDNQLKVNRFIANELDALNEAIENIDFPEGADLSGYATKEQLDALADDSAATDNSLFKAIEEESTKTNVALTALQIELNNVDKKSQNTDRDLQNQINDIDEKIDAIDVPDGVDLSPVEDRLDTIEGVLPKAPLIIPPVEIGSGKILIDHPTRPSGADKPPEGECWMWHMDADRTGNPANEMKTTVSSEYQGNVIIDGINTVWFKQGDRVQKWNTANGGWWTGGNLWHLSASSTEGDTLIEGQPFEIYYVDPNAEGDDFIDAISRLESKADDRKLQAEIEVLSGQLSTLVKSQEDGEWKFVGSINFNVPRNAGEFALLTSELTSQTNGVVLREEDLNGITHNFNAPVGSYIEIVDIEEPLDYVLFEVTKEPDGDGLVQIDTKMVKAGNDFEINDRCIIRFFEVSEGLDINELDNRYLKLAGGTMKGDLNLSGSLPSIGYTDDQGQNWVQLRFGTTTEYKGWYSTDDAIATKKRVQEQIDAALSGSGSKSITTTQMMVGAYTYWDMPAGRFTLIQSNQTSPTLNPNNAYGIRFYPAQEWWENTHEPIAGGYISLCDPFTGKVQFAGKVDRVEKDNSAANRWSFFIPFAYKWGDNLNPDGQFLITLSGCLREK